MLYTFIVIFALPFASALPIDAHSSQVQTLPQDASFAAFAPHAKNVVISTKLNIRGVPDQDAVLRDITDTVLGFLGNLGQETKQAFNGLVSGLQNTADYVESWVGQLLHGNFRNSSGGGSSWNPFYEVLAYGTNLLADSLKNAKDPSMLASDQSVMQLTETLKKVLNLGIEMRLDTSFLGNAIDQLSATQKKH